MAIAPFMYRYDHMKFEKHIPQVKKELLKEIAIFGKKASGKGTFGLQRRLAREGGYAPNNPWWKKAKGEKRVFYDSGFWRTRPTYRIIPSAGDTFFICTVGFVDPIPHPSSRQSGDFNVQRIAAFLARGARWTPTDKKRKAFWAAISRRGVKVDPKKVERKSIYNVPRRDFINKHINDPRLKKLYNDHIDKAIAKAMKTTPRKKVSG